MSAEARRRGAAAAALTLLSGTLMMLAGYVAETESWATAGFVTIPGGIAILAAFAFSRRPGVADGRNVTPTGRFARPSVMIVTLGAGGVMVSAGYAGAAWSWGLALPLAILGGLIIAAAFALDLHSG
jgi:hypothetical protein